MQVSHQAMHQPMVAMVPVISVAPPAQTIHLSARAMKILGSLQVFFGIACIVVNAVAISEEAHIANVSHGIWCGVLFIVTGGICIASYGKNKCLVITTLVLSFVSVAFAMGFVFALSVVALNYDIHHQRCNYRQRTTPPYRQRTTPPYGSYPYPNYPYPNYPPLCELVEGSPPKEALDSVLLILGVFEAFTALASAVLTIKAVCCTRNNTVPTQQGNPNLQVGQAVMCVTQPGMQPHVQPGFQPTMPQPYPVMMVDNNAQFYQAQGLPQAAAPPQWIPQKEGVPMQTGQATPPPAYSSIVPPYSSIN